MSALNGVEIVVSSYLPAHPGHREDARRIVRHGMADILAWLGEDVGPRPGEPTHAYFTKDRAFVSREVADMLRLDDA